MTERSFYWGGTSIGDATDSPYDNDEFSDIWRKLFTVDRTLQGIIEGYENELAVTNPSGLIIAIDTGAALVDGKFYESDAFRNFSRSAPAVLTRIDRIVLRKSWASQTVRLVVRVGTEGGGVPNLIQNDGTLWEIPIAQVSITTGSVVTITDERNNARTPLADEVEGSLVHIETLSGDGSSANIDFTGIADTYRHLFIEGNIRLAGAVTDADVNLRINNDGGANYHEQDLVGANVTVAATAAASQTEANVGTFPGANATANYVGQIEIRISNYKNSSYNKSFLGKFTSIPNVTVADFDAGVFGGIWLSVAAITQVTLISSSGNFAAGTEISLYGIL